MAWGKTVEAPGELAGRGGNFISASSEAQMGVAKSHRGAPGQSMAAVFILHSSKLDELRPNPAL